MKLVDTMETPEIDADAAPAELPEMMRKKQIVERTADLTGLSKGEVRRVLDAGLGVLRDALAEGTEVHYPSLGKVKIKVPDREGAKPQLRVSLAKPEAERGQGGDGQPDDMGLDDNL